MDTRTLALTQGLGRVVIGAAMLAVPERINAGWVGGDAERPGGRVLSRALAARDFSLGAGQAAAVQRGLDARPWILAGTFCDLVDLLATVRASDRLPSSGVALVGALATGSTLLGAYLLAADEI